MNCRLVAVGMEAHFTLLVSRGLKSHLYDPTDKMSYVRNSNYVSFLKKKKIIRAKRKKNIRAKR